MFSWFKKNRKSTTDGEKQSVEAPNANGDTNGNGAMTVDDSASSTPGPAAVQSADESGHGEDAVPSRQFWNAGLSQNDWVGEIYQDQLKKGAFDNLPGKGKPISIPSGGDLTNHILKNANYLPAWLELQHEIRDQLHRLLSSAKPDVMEQELLAINEKIKKYNTMVPSTMLQKQKITQDNLQQQYELWV